MLKLFAFGLGQMRPAFNKVYALDGLKLSLFAEETVVLFPLPCLKRDVIVYGQIWLIIAIAGYDKCRQVLRYGDRIGVSLVRRQIRYAHIMLITWCKQPCVELEADERAEEKSE